MPFTGQREQGSRPRTGQHGAAGGALPGCPQYGPVVKNQELEADSLGWKAPPPLTSWGTWGGPGSQGAPPPDK